MSTPTRSRRMRQVIPVVALAATGVAGGTAVLAGCGSSASAGAAPASIAGYIPSQSPVYVQVSTDTSGPQWTQLVNLGKLFPGYGDMKAGLDASLAREDIDWDKDLRPLLGEAAALATTKVPDTASVVTGSLSNPAAAAGRAAATAGDQPVLAVMQIAEGKSAEVKALITKGTSGLRETGTYQGAMLYADAAAGMNAAVTDESLIIGSSEEVVKQSLDAHAAGGEAVLSGIFRFNDALALLPKDVFAMAYVNLETLGKSAAEDIPQAGALVDGQVSGAAAMSVTAEDDGLRMKAVLVDGPPTADQKPYAPTLTAQAPADAVAYVGFNRLADTVETAVSTVSASSSGDTKKQLDALTGQLPLLLGVNGADLRNLTGGEHAVVVTGSGPKPGVALALKTADGAQARKSLTALSTSIPALLTKSGGATVKGAWTTVDLEGTDGRRLALGGDRNVVWGVRGDLAVIGSGLAPVGQVLGQRAPSTSLAQSPSFVAATKGMPEEVSGLVWVNMRQVLRLMAANGAFDGPGGARKRADLKPITGIAAWTTPGETPTVELVVGMGT